MDIVLVRYKDSLSYGGLYKVTFVAGRTSVKFMLKMKNYWYFQ